MTQSWKHQPIAMSILEPRDTNSEKSIPVIYHESGPLNAPGSKPEGHKDHFWQRQHSANSDDRYRASVRDAFTLLELTREGDADIVCHEE